MINSALKVVEKWSRDQGLSVNPAKTELMRFTRKIQPEIRQPFSAVTLNGVEIPLKDKVKYLGLMLDPKLLMNKHADYITTSALKSLWAVRNMVSKRNGGPRQC